MRRNCLVLAGFLLFACYSLGALSAVQIAQTALSRKEDFSKLRASMSKGEFDIKWDDVANSRAVKNRGASVQFHVYLVYWLRLLNADLKDEQFQLKKVFAHLCQQSGCSKGLDMNKVGPKDIPLVLQYANYRAGSVLKIRTAGKNMVFLQGFVSDLGLHDYREAMEEAVRTLQALPDRQSIQQIRDFVEKHNATEISVNLPHQFGPDLNVFLWPPIDLNGHYNVGAFMELGRFIKEKNLNLRILGGCGTHCVNYLLPAARTVIIEPYGFVYTKGSVHGLFYGASNAQIAQRDYHLQQFRETWLPQLKTATPLPLESADVLKSGGLATGLLQQKPPSRLVSFVSIQMLQGFGVLQNPTSVGMTEAQRAEGIYNFSVDLSNWGQSVWEQVMRSEFSTIVTEHQQKKRRSFKNWTGEDIIDFVLSMDNDKQRYLLEELAVFFRMHRDPKVRGWRRYIVDLEWLRQHTVSYRREITVSLSSQTLYDYGMLLDVTANLVRDRRYEEVFSVPKTHYAVSESDKPYVAAPSEELLRALGINVKGENRREILAMNWGNKVLYLDSKTIQNCELMNFEIFHTKETFEKCLSRP